MPVAPEIAMRTWAGLAVVFAIFVSACVAGYEAVARLIEPRDVEDLGALALAGAIGFAGNWIAALRAPARAAISTAPRWSPTAHTPAQTPTSAWR